MRSYIIKGTIRRRLGRVIALLTCASFLQTTLMPPAQASIPLSVKVHPISALPLDFASIQLPAEIGKIDDNFTGTSDFKVIVVQDAHAIPDAQRSIRKAILYFYQKYGINLVALEGASAKLDARMLKSFPDKDRLNKVLGEYFDQGELAGGTAAAISGIKAEDNSAAGTRMIFQGVEDWPVYEEALGLYLTAMGQEENLLKEVESRKLKVESQKQKKYAPELLKMDAAIRAFREDQSDFMKTLKALAEVKAPETGSELELLLQEAKSEGEDQTGAEIEVRGIAEMIKDTLQKNGGQANPPPSNPRASKTQVTSEKIREFNQKHQEFQTGQLSAKAMALFLREFLDKSPVLYSRLPSKEHGQARLLASLTRLSGSAKRMRDIEGTKLFSDFERYMQSIKDALLTSDEARALDKQDRQLWLMTKLAKLELSYEEWEELKSHKTPSKKTAGKQVTLQKNGGQARHKSQATRSQKKGAEGLGGMDDGRRTMDGGAGDGKEITGNGMEDSLRPLFLSHFSFYENALKRDEIFFKNLSLLLKLSASPQKAALLVAGGFHARGLCSLLKQNGISYVLVMPEIKNLPEQSNYRQHMQGHVSWKNYFEVKHGKVNLYNAFIRGTRDRLLGRSRLSPVASRLLENTSDERPETRDPALLKTWRDQIIRDLADEGRIEKAGEYTRFIDELTGEGHEQAVQKRLKQVEHFLEGLKQLDSEGKFNAANIAKLMPQAAVPDGASSGAVLAGGGESEIRAFALGLTPFNQPPADMRKAEPNVPTAKSEVRNQKDANAEGQSLTPAAFGIQRERLELQAGLDTHDAFEAATKVFTETAALSETMRNIFGIEILPADVLSLKVSLSGFSSRQKIILKATVRYQAEGREQESEFLIYAPGYQKPEFLGEAASYEPVAKVSRKMAEQFGENEVVPRFGGKYEASIEGRKIPLVTAELAKGKSLFALGPQLSDAEKEYYQRQAVKMFFAIYQNSGRTLFVDDIGLGQVVLDLEGNGAWSMRIVDLGIVRSAEAGNELSAKTILKDIFSGPFRLASEGSESAWIWSGRQDKTGFFDGIIDGMGREAGEAFIREVAISDQHARTYLATGIHRYEPLPDKPVFDKRSQNTLVYAPAPMEDAPSEPADVTIQNLDFSAQFFGWLQRHGLFQGTNFDTKDQKEALWAAYQQWRNPERPGGGLSHRQTLQMFWGHVKSYGVKLAESQASGGLSTLTLSGYLLRESKRALSSPASRAAAAKSEVRIWGDGFVSDQAAEDYIAAHKPEFRDLARFLLQHITYIDEAQFGQALEAAVKNFMAEQGDKPFVIVTSKWPQNKQAVKSELFVYQQAMEKGLRQPEAIVEAENLASWLEDYAQTNTAASAPSILILDDAAYSGFQLYNFLSKLLNNFSITQGNDLDIHLLVPFTTALAKEKINSNRSSTYPVHFHTTQTIKTVGEIFEEAKQGVDESALAQIQKLEEQAREAYESFDVTLAKLTFKAADGESTSPVLSGVVAPLHRSSDNIKQVSFLKGSNRWDTPYKNNDAFWAYLQNAGLVSPSAKSEVRSQKDEEVDNTTPTRSAAEALRAEIDSLREEIRVLSTRRVNLKRNAAKLKGEALIENKRESAEVNDQIEALKKKIQNFEEQSYLARRSQNQTEQSERGRPEGDERIPAAIQALAGEVDPALLQWAWRIGLLERENPVLEADFKELHSVLIETEVDDKVHAEGAQAIAIQDRGTYRTKEIALKTTAVQAIPAEMEKFIDWLNFAEKQTPADRKQEMVAEAFIRFIEIHPFADWNGRTGRQVINLLLLRNRLQTIDLSLLGRDMRVMGFVDQLPGDAVFLGESIRRAQRGVSSAANRRYGPRDQQLSDLKYPVLRNKENVSSWGFLNWIRSQSLYGLFNQQQIETILKKTSLDESQYDDFLSNLTTAIRKSKYSHPEEKFAPMLNYFSINRTRFIARSEVRGQNNGNSRDDTANREKVQVSGEESLRGLGFRRDEDRVLAKSLIRDRAQLAGAVMAIHGLQLDAKADWTVEIDRKQPPAGTRKQFVQLQISDGTQNLSLGLLVGYFGENEIEVKQELAAKEIGPKVAQTSSGRALFVEVIQGQSLRQMAESGKFAVAFKKAVQQELIVRNKLSGRRLTDMGLRNLVDDEANHRVVTIDFDDRVDSAGASLVKIALMSLAVVQIDSPFSPVRVQQEMNQMAADLKGMLDEAAFTQELEILRQDVTKLPERQAQFINQFITTAAALGQKKPPGFWQRLFPQLSAILSGEQSSERSEVRLAPVVGVGHLEVSRALDSFSHVLNNPTLITAMTPDEIAIGRYSYQLTRNAMGQQVVQMADFGTSENAKRASHDFRELGALTIDAQNSSDVRVAKQLWMILRMGQSLARPEQTAEQLARVFVQQINIASVDSIASGLSPPDKGMQARRKPSRPRAAILEHSIAHHARMRQINSDGQKAQTQLVRLSEQDRLTLIIQTALNSQHEPTPEERVAFERSEIRVQKVSEVPGMAERMTALGVRDHYAGFIEITDQARQFMFENGIFQEPTSKGFINDPGQYGPRTLNGHEINFFRAVGSYLYVANESIKYPVHESFHHRAGGKTAAPATERGDVDERDFLEELQAYFGMNVLPGGAMDPAYRSELRVALSYNYAGTPERRRKAERAIQVIQQIEPLVLPAYLTEFLGRVRSVDEINALGDLITDVGELDAQAVIDIIMPAGLTPEEIQTARRAGLNPQAVARLDLQREALDREYLRDLIHPTSEKIQAWANQWALLRVGYLIGTQGRSEVRIVQEWLADDDPILRQATEFALQQLGLKPEALVDLLASASPSDNRSEVRSQAARKTLGLRVAGAVAFFAGLGGAAQDAMAQIKIQLTIIPDVTQEDIFLGAIWQAGAVFFSLLALWAVLVLARSILGKWLHIPWLGIGKSSAAKSSEKDDQSRSLLRFSRFNLSSFFIFFTIIAISLGAGSQIYYHGNRAYEEDLTAAARTGLMPFYPEAEQKRAFEIVARDEKNEVTAIIERIVNGEETLGEQDKTAYWLLNENIAFEHLEQLLPAIEKLAGDVKSGNRESELFIDLTGLLEKKLLEKQLTQDDEPKLAAIRETYARIVKQHLESETEQSSYVVFYAARILALIFADPNDPVAIPIFESLMNPKHPSPRGASGLAAGFSKDPFRAQNPGVAVYAGRLWSLVKPGMSTEKTETRGGLVFKTIYPMDLVGLLNRDEREDLESLLNELKNSGAPEVQKAAATALGEKKRSEVRGLTRRDVLWAGTSAVIATGLLVALGLNLRRDEQRPQVLPQTNPDGQGFEDLAKSEPAKAEVVLQAVDEILERSKKQGNTALMNLFGTEKWKQYFRVLPNETPLQHGHHHEAEHDHGASGKASSDLIGVHEGALEWVLGDKVAGFPLFARTLAHEAIHWTHLSEAVLIQHDRENPDEEEPVTREETAFLFEEMPHYWRNENQKKVVYGIFFLRDEQGRFKFENGEPQFFVNAYDSEQIPEDEVNAAVIKEIEELLHNPKKSKTVHGRDQTLLKAELERLQNISRSQRSEVRVAAQNANVSFEDYQDISDIALSADGNQLTATVLGQSVTLDKEGVGSTAAIFRNDDYVLKLSAKSLVHEESISAAVREAFGTLGEEARPSVVEVLSHGTVIVQGKVKYALLMKAFPEGVEYKKVFREKPSQADIKVRLDFFKKYLAAIRQLFEAGIAPADLKGANLLIRQDGNIQVIDLGSFLDARSDASQVAEDKNDSIGHTPAYVTFTRIRELRARYDAKTLTAEQFLRAIALSELHKFLIRDVFHDNPSIGGKPNLNYKGEDVRGIVEPLFETKTDQAMSAIGRISELVDTNDLLTSENVLTQFIEQIEVLTNLAPEGSSAAQLLQGVAVVSQQTEVSTVQEEDLDSKIEGDAAALGPRLKVVLGKIFVEGQIGAFNALAKGIEDEKFSFLNGVSEELKKVRALYGANNFTQDAKPLNPEGYQTFLLNLQAYLQSVEGKGVDQMTVEALLEAFQGSKAEDLTPLITAIVNDTVFDTIADSDPRAPVKKAVTQVGLTKGQWVRIEKTLTEKLQAAASRETVPVSARSRSELREALAPSVETLARFVEYGKMSPQEFWENVAQKLERMKGAGMSVDDVTAFLSLEVRAFVDSKGTVNAISNEAADEFNALVLQVFAPSGNSLQGGAYGVSFSGQENLSELAAVARAIAQQLASDENTLLIKIQDRITRNHFNEALNSQKVGIHRIPISGSQLDASRFLGSAQLKLPMIYDAMGEQFGDDIAGIGISRDLGSQAVVVPADLAVMQLSRTLLQFAAARYVAFAAPGESLNGRLKAALINQMGLAELKDPLPDIFLTDGQNNLAVSENAVFKMLNMVTEMRAQHAVKSAA